MEVKVKMETRFYIECPRCGSEIDVDSYEATEDKCVICSAKYSYNSEPQNCETV